MKCLLALDYSHDWEQPLMVGVCRRAHVPLCACVCTCPRVCLRAHVPMCVCLRAHVPPCVPACARAPLCACVRTCPCVCVLLGPEVFGCVPGMILPSRWCDTQVPLGPSVAR